MRTSLPEPDWADFRPPVDDFDGPLDEIAGAIDALGAAATAHDQAVRVMELAAKARAMEALANGHVFQIVEARGALCRQQREVAEAGRFVDLGEGEGFGPQDGDAR